MAPHALIEAVQTSPETNLTVRTSLL